MKTAWLVNCLLSGQIKKLFSTSDQIPKMLMSSHRTGLEIDFFPKKDTEPPPTVFSSEGFKMIHLVLAIMKRDDLDV
jgi:hypothetical protein